MWRECNLHKLVRLPPLFFPHSFISSDIQLSAVTVTGLPWCTRERVPLVGAPPLCTSSRRSGTPTWVKMPKRPHFRWAEGKPRYLTCLPHASRMTGMELRPHEDFQFYSSIISEFRPSSTGPGQSIMDPLLHTLSRVTGIYHIVRCLESQKSTLGNVPFDNSTFPRPSPLVQLDGSGECFARFRRTQVP